MNIPFIGSALRRRPVQIESTAETGIAGTLSLYTEHGPIPAFLVSPGDRVIRRGRGPVTVVDIQFGTHHGKMVRISPNALGRARPEDFVLLPPDQRLYLRGFEALARDGLFAARDLVDHDLVTWVTPSEPVRLVKFVFDRVEIVHAGGLELEFGC